MTALFRSRLLNAAMASIAGLALLLAVSLSLTACVSFLPDQRQDIVAKLSNVEDQLAKIRATIEADAPSPTPYERVEPYYVAALASLKQAENVANSREAYSKGKLSQIPAENSVRAIANCRNAIELNRRDYKGNGPSPNQDDNLDVLENNCSIPKFMESLFRK